MIASSFASLTTYFQKEKLSAKHAVIITACLFSLTLSVVDSSNALGWITISFTYLLLLDRKIFQYTPIFFAVLAALTAHHLISLINFYDVTTAFKQVDANGFHRHASKMLAGEMDTRLTRVGSGTYPTIISYLYQLQHSLLFGQSLNILAFVFANMVLLRLLALLNISLKHCFWIILLFGFLPNQVILGATLLREPWQLLFLMLPLYFGMQWYQSRAILSSTLPLFLISAACFGVLHKGFYIYLVCLLGLFSLYDLAKHKMISLFAARAVISIVFLACLGLALQQYFVNNGPQKELFRVVLNYMSSNAVISDGEPLQTSSLTDFVKDTSAGYKDSITRREANSSYGHLGVTGSYLRYQFGPPLLDIFQENTKFLVKMTTSYAYYFVLKLAYLFAIIACFRQTNIRLELITLFIAYLGMNVLWSLGTENYGTAIRHLMVSDWLILTIGVPTGVFYIKQGVSRLNKRFAEKNSPSLEANSA